MHISITGRAVRSRSGSSRLLAASLSVAVLLVAGCGDDDDSEATGSAEATTQQPEGEATSGSGADESLEPVRIGFINQEAGSVGTYPEASVAAEAAVEYINTELGGVDGHPIELVTCETDGTTQSSQRCAEEMVSEDVLYVASGVDATRSALYSVLQPAEIPTIGGVPLTGADFDQEGAYFFGGGGATVFPSQPAYVLDLASDVDTVGLLSNDTPGSLAAIPMIREALDAAGVELLEVQVPASQSDWLAPFVSVSDADVIIANINPQNCISLADAMRTQGSDIPVLTTSSCLSQSVIDAVGDALDGWKIIQGYTSPQADTDDAQLYREVMDEYAGPDAQLTGFAQYVFSDFMTMYRNVLADASYEQLTSEYVVDAVTDPAGGQIFMGPEYLCGAEGAPYAAICNYSQSFATIEDGEIVEQSDFIDVSEYISAT